MEQKQTIVLRKDLNMRKGKMIAQGGLIAALIQDAGLTAFGGVPTCTALAVGPDRAARADRVDAITGALPLL